MQLQFNCNATAMQLQCNCNATAMQLQCNCNLTLTHADNFDFWDNDSEKEKKKKVTARAFRTGPEAKNYTLTS